MNKKTILFFAALLSACVFAGAREYELPAPESDSFIYFSADEFNYDADQRLVSLLGDVTLILSRPGVPETRIFSQNLIVDQNASTIFNTGDVRVEQQGGELTAQNINYNYEEKSLRAENITAYFPPIRLLHADSAEIKDGRQRYRNAKVTCCDYEPPHYYIKAGSISMSPQKRIFGYNGLLYLSDIPVFYIPVFWRSLEPKQPWTTYVDFSQSNRTGLGLLTNTVFFPTRNIRAIINLDGYTKSGFGYGAQALAVNTDRVIGSVEGYAINDEAEDGKYRWGVNGGYWARLFDNSDMLNSEEGGAIYTSQGKFRSVSDPYFNDTFFRGNPFKYMPDQDISFAFSRQSRSSITRLSYTQRDEFNSLAERYETIEKTLPRLEHVLMPFTGPLGIVNNLSFNLYNTEVEDKGFEQRAAAVWRSARAFKVTDRFTFTPYGTVDERIIYRDRNFDNETSYFTRVGGGANLRGELPTGSLDLSYAYLQRLQRGTIELDDDTPDRGQESSMVYLQNYYRPTMYSYFRAGVGYDLRNDDQSWAFDERLEPLLLEAGYYQPEGLLNFFVQNQYDFADGNRSFITNSDFKLFKASRGVLGMTNHASDRNSYLFNTAVYFRPTGSSVYFDAGVDFEIKQGTLSAYSKSFRLYKDFHDAHIQIGVEDRNKNLSFALRMTLVCGGRPRKETFTREDKFWTPWRRPGDLRD